MQNFNEIRSAASEENRRWVPNSQTANLTSSHKHRTDNEFICNLHSSLYLEVIDRHVLGDGLWIHSAVSACGAVQALPGCPLLEWNGRHVPSSTRPRYCSSVMSTDELARKASCGLLLNPPDVEKFFLLVFARCHCNARTAIPPARRRRLRTCRLVTPQEFCCRKLLHYGLFSRRFCRTENVCDAMCCVALRDGGNQALVEYECVECVRDGDTVCRR